MNRQFNMTFRGREYTVIEGADAEGAAQGGGAVAGAGQWFVSLGPKAIGSVESVPGEPEAAARERIERWLAEQPQLPQSEQIVLGGG